MTSHSGQDPQNCRYIQSLCLCSVEDGCLSISWVWFCVQRTKYGWKQHTQSWGGQVHSTALTLCTDKSILLKLRLCGKNKDDVTVIRVFLLSTSIISRALSALAVERSPTAWIGSTALNKNAPSDLSINLPAAQTLFSKRPFRWTKLMNFSVHQNSDTINWHHSPVKGCLSLKYRTIAYQIYLSSCWTKISAREKTWSQGAYGGIQPNPQRFDT